MRRSERVVTSSGQCGRFTFKAHHRVLPQIAPARVAFGRETFLDEAVEQFGGGRVVCDDEATAEGRLGKTVSRDSGSIEAGCRLDAFDQNLPIC